MHLSRTEKFRVWWQLYVLRRDWAFIKVDRREHGLVIHNDAPGLCFDWYVAPKVLGPFYRRPRRGYFRGSPAAIPDPDRGCNWRAFVGAPVCHPREWHPRTTTEACRPPAIRSVLARR